MKKLKKWLRHFLLACLIILACFGIGLSGGIPIPASLKREEKMVVEVEAPDIESENEDDQEIYKT